MNRDYEALSAFLDGETSELEARRVMRDLDGCQLDTLSRWQLARDVLHGQASQMVPGGFNARLAEALAAESKPGKRAGMIGGFARVAVAASVAAATVIGWQYWNEPSEMGDARPAVAVSAANDAESESNASVAEQPLTRPFGQTSLVAQEFGPAARQRQQAQARTVSASQQPWMNAMMLRHSEFAARHSGQGMMPYARLVSMDAREGAQ